MNCLSHTELMKALIRKEEEAFRTIYELYWSRLYSVCYHYTRSREESEDLLMEIFMSLWNNRNKAEIDNIENYLVKAAKYKCLKFILKQQRQKEKLHLFRRKATESVKDEISPEKLLESKELKSQLLGELQALPDKTKEIFLLNRESGLTYQEIASYMGVSVKTVEYHISKALNRLSKYTLLLSVFFPF